MKANAIFVFLFLSTITLSGCMGIGGSDYSPRTLEYTLEVAAGMDNTVPVYTLNQGNEMRIVAAGFRVPGEALEVPNPQIRLREGDTLILHIVNNNQMPHTFHLHGGLVPWNMDGVPFLSQMPIHQGESYTYKFENMKAGTYWYHCHVDAAHHIDLGMYGAFIVEENKPTIKFDREFVMMLDESDNCHVHGNTDPVTGAEQNYDISQRADCLQRFTEDYLNQNQVINPATQALCTQLGSNAPPELGCGAHTMTPFYTPAREWYPTSFPVYEPVYNTFMINGKAYPDTKPMVVEEGETVKIRLINVGFEWHTMHIHGHNMLVTHRDGYELDSPFRVDTLGIGPGERYDVIMKMENPGYWSFHDHMALNVRNDAQAPGGMLTYIAYDDFFGRDATQFKIANEVLYEAIEIIAEGGGGHDGHGMTEAQAILNGRREIQDLDGNVQVFKAT